MGGGIFAKTAKTPPLQSALAGIALRSKCHCRRHTPAMPPRDTRGCYNDAARHVATKTVGSTAMGGRRGWMVCAYVVGGSGRGNLRENREDPAPTVGIAGMPLRSKCRPAAASMRIPTKTVKSPFERCDRGGWICPGESSSSSSARIDVDDHDTSRFCRLRPWPFPERRGQIRQRGAGHLPRGGGLPHGVGRYRYGIERIIAPMLAGRPGSHPHIQRIHIPTAGDRYGEA